MRKDRAQWDDIKDLFVIQHLLKATRQGKKSDSGFKKEVWSELQKNVNTKFGVILAPKQFYTRGLRREFRTSLIYFETRRYIACNT
jgi:hypothetical protein